MPNALRPNTGDREHDKFGLESGTTVLNVRLIGSDGGNLDDNRSGSIPIITTPHWYIHRGLFWTATDFDGDIDITDEKYWWIHTGSKHSHIFLGLDTTASGHVDFYKNPTTLASSGTALTNQNNFTGSSNTSETTIYSGTASVATKGALLAHSLVGSPGRKEPVGGNVRAGSEWILEKDSDFLIQLQVDNDDTACALNVEWYDEE